MSVVGIDFGNLSALIAQAAKGGVDVILNDASNRLTATCVSIQGKQRFIGDSGAALQRTNIKNTISAMKLLVGRKFDEPDVQRELKRSTFSSVKLPSGGVGIKVIYNDEEMVLSAEHVMAMMIVKLKDIAAKANSGVQIGESVLTVPYWFTDAQRRGVLNACEIAQLNCLKIANESTAIALSFGIYKSAKKLFSETDPIHVMFIDIGYSCYSVTIVDFIQEKLIVRATVTDKQFGGRDFDDLIVEWLCADFQKKSGINVRVNVKAILKLQVAAESAKKTLSPTGVSEAKVSVECLAEDMDLNTMFTKDNFESIAAGLIGRLSGPVNQCLLEAGLQREQLSDVEIVGGSSRIGFIKKTLAEILGLDLSSTNFGLKTTMNSDEAVARGAALQCAILSSKIKVKPFTIIDKVPYPITVYFDSADISSESYKADSKEDDAADDNNTFSDKASVELYAKGDDFPRSARRITFRKAKSDFTLKIAYSESATNLLPEGQDKHIATYVVKIPPGKEPLDVRVSFNLDKNGCIVVTSAEMMEPIVEEPKPIPESKDDKASSKETSDDKAEQPPAPPKKRFAKIPLNFEVQTFGLSKNQIKEALELEANMANEDRLITETADKRNELESYIYSMRDKICGSLKSFGSDAEKSSLNSLLADSEEWLYGDGFDSVKSMYAKKLDDLKAIGDKIEYRQNESELRDSSVDALKKQVEMCKVFAANRDEAFSHINDDERDRLISEAKSAENWLYDMLGKQGELEKFNDPVLTTSSIQAKRNSLFSLTNPIMTKPKPKPAPVATPASSEEKKEDPPKSDEKSSENEKEADKSDKSEPMDM